nr:6-phosphofructokinase [Kiritimatiellia bacterium]
EAIDRLDTTATSHHRIIVGEIMGHSAGWLALGAGIAGGADVILIPEIPYDMKSVVESLVARRQHGKRFSIIAVAEGAVSREEAAARAAAAGAGDGKKDRKKKDRKEAKKTAGAKKDSEQPTIRRPDGVHLVNEPMASRIARQIQQLTGIEARVTSLGHVQRGGSPTATDRLLCTRLGTRAGQLLRDGVYNVMVAVKGDDCVAVPLEKVAGVTKLVTEDHPWVHTARLVGTCLGE